MQKEISDSLWVSIVLLNRITCVKHTIITFFFALCSDTDSFFCAHSNPDWKSCIRDDLPPGAWDNFAEKYLYDASSMHGKKIPAWGRLHVEGTYILNMPKVSLLNNNITLFLFS